VASVLEQLDEGLCPVCEAAVAVPPMAPGAGHVELRCAQCGASWLYLATPGAPRPGPVAMDSAAASAPDPALDPAPEAAPPAPAIAAIDMAADAASPPLAAPPLPDPEPHAEPQPQPQSEPAFEPVAEPAVAAPSPAPMLAPISAPMPAPVSAPAMSPATWAEAPVAPDPAPPAPDVATSPLPPGRFAIVQGALAAVGRVLHRPKRAAPELRLACPSCGTTYRIAAHEALSGGREVRCARCDHQWRQASW
jgi:predicted Zn finger-like uncharacterized protein